MSTDRAAANRLFGRLLRVIVDDQHDHGPCEAMSALSALVVTVAAHSHDPAALLEQLAQKIPSMIAEAEAEHAGMDDEHPDGVVH